MSFNVNTYVPFFLAPLVTTTLSENRYVVRSDRSRDFLPPKNALATRSFVMVDDSCMCSLDGSDGMPSVFEIASARWHLSSCAMCSLVLEVTSRMASNAALT